MSYALDWLADALHERGLRVAEVPGWRTRGRGEMGAAEGVLCHHTATALPGNMPSLRLLTEGRGDLPGPLCHLGLGRDGTFYAVAAGRANHAGAGAWQGRADCGNAHFVGIEAENAGTPAEPWPAVQAQAYRRGAAAILARLGTPAGMCIGHKEYAPRRKTDPSFDMGAFRAGVAALLDGTAPAPPPLPASDAAGRPTLHRGDRGEDVAALQAWLGIPADGRFGPHTEAALRARQRERRLVPDGICGPATWAATG